MNKPFLFALLSSIIWGIAPVLEKIGLSGKLDPYTGVVLRSVPIIIAGVVGLFILGKTEGLMEVDLKSAAFVMAGGLLAGFLGQITYYTALKSGEASVVVPVAATFPLVALIVSVLFLGEAVTWQKAGGVSMVVMGVILLK